MKITFKYRYRNEFVSFLKSENIYIEYRQYLKEESLWMNSPYSFTKFFDCVDARRYLDIVTWRHNETQEEYRQRLKVTRKWNYYKVLWLLSLLSNGKLNLGYYNEGDDVSFYTLKEITTVIQDPYFEWNWRLINELENVLFHYCNYNDVEDNSLIKKIKKEIKHHKARLMHF